MNAKELRQKTAAELKGELLNLRREQFNLRMAQASGQATKPDQFSKVRRTVARLKTVLGEQVRTQGHAPVQTPVPAKTPAKVQAKVNAKVKGGK